MQNDREDVLLLEQRRCAAITAGDAAALEALLADDYVHIHATGAVDDRAGHIKSILTRPRVLTRGEILVRLYGPVAVLTGELTNTWQDGEVVPNACLQVAVKQDGAWRFVSAQLTRKA